MFPPRAEIHRSHLMPRVKLHEKRISNIEQGMSNVEGWHSINPDSPEKVKANIRTSTFCGSLFDILRFAFSGFHTLRRDA
jgi:hypothetical protein